MSYILGNQFRQTFSHHSSVKALWEDLWKKPVSGCFDCHTRSIADIDQCSMGIYPFVDGKLEDFQEIFDKLIAVSGESYVQIPGAVPLLIIPA
jgi:hypothetical protein